MKRIIIEQSKVVEQPSQAVAVKDPNGVPYWDYLTDGETPFGAAYVGEMEPDGCVTDLVGTWEQFAHVFAGWDKRRAEA